MKDEDALVEVRCSVVVFRKGQVLAIRRAEQDDWVLPGGRPREGESMVACARREVEEETGLRVAPRRCLYVSEVTDHEQRDRLVELTFLAVEDQPGDQPETREHGRVPQFVDIAVLRREVMRPGLAGHLAALPGRVVAGSDLHFGAAYLGNLWRPRGN